MKVQFFNLNSVDEKLFTRVVCVCKYKNKWLFAKHKERGTWEIPGGHIEENETWQQACERELFEETGATDYELIPIFDYCGYTKTERSNGVLFLAIIHTLGELPGYEMERVKTFKKYPKNLTYPLVTPIMFKNAKKYLK